jgi:hypothetical protein
VSVREWPIVQGASEGFLTVARSPAASSGIAVLGLVAAALAYLKDPVAGAVILGSLIVAFSSLGVYALILRDRFGGLYETISDESDWDIHDSAGFEAVLVRRRRLHFLQNGVFAIRDYAWGDGDLLADYEISPGVRADTYTVAGKRSVVISLRETKRRGDVETYLITRRMRNMFVKDSEWVATEVTLPTQEVKITVRFPADRPPQGAWLKQNSAPDHKQQKLPIEGGEDRRQTVSVRIQRPKLYETYTVWWKW